MRLLGQVSVLLIQSCERFDRLLRSTLLRFKSGLPLLKIGREESLDMRRKVANASAASIDQIGIQV